MEYLNQFRWGKYVNWSLLFAFLSLVFCILMFYLATWSPSFSNLTEPEKNINYRLVNFIFHGQPYFGLFGFCALGLTICQIVRAKFHIVFRIIMFVTLCLALIFGVDLLLRGGVSDFDMLYQEQFEETKFNLVYFVYTNYEQFSFPYLVIYQCNIGETTCRALHSRDLQVNEVQDSYHLRVYDTNELVLTDGEVVFWSTELSE